MCIHNGGQGSGAAGEDYVLSQGGNRTGSSSGKSEKFKETSVTLKTTQIVSVVGNKATGSMIVL